MSDLDLDAYRWLTSPEAQPWLESIAASEEPLVPRAKRLRRSLSPVVTHLVMEQVELRRRARGKFSQADRMFFTSRALEQSTSEKVASWKSRRFSELSSSPQPSHAWADLCCGIGGDLMAMAWRAPTVGVDRDPIVAHLARANLAAIHGEPCGVVQNVDVAQFAVESVDAWHLDPDRRAGAERVAQPEFAEPGVEVVEAMLRRNPAAGIKLAPAARLPERWTDQCEREWISEQGECKQQVAWFGRLAQAHGRRSAAVLTKGAPPRVFSGTAGMTAPLGPIRRFLYEPDASVLAADLAGALAATHGLEAIAPDIGYFTSDRYVIDAALAAFELHEVLPFDRKRLRALLRDRNVGRLELKKRGVDVELERLRRELRLSGDTAACLLLAPVQGKNLAILAQRMVHPASMKG